MNQAYEANRESVENSGTPIRASRIGLGTCRNASRVTRAAIDRILRETITDPIGPGFMAPLTRS